jgi:hypothetical protein
MSDRVSEIVTKIGEEQVRRNAVRMDIESLQINETASDEKIAELKAELAEAKKPKLRHGDYDIDKRLIVKANKDLDLYWCDEDGVCADQRGNVVDGNSYDDLKSMQETVTEFIARNIDRDNDRSFEMTLTDDGHVRIHISPDGASSRFFTVSSRDLPKLSMFIRQAEVTLRREEAKSD